MKIESQKYIVTSTKITQNAVIFVSFHQDTPFPFSLLPVDDYLITLIFQIQSLPKKFNGKKMHVRNAARHMKSRVFFFQSIANYLIIPLYPQSTYLRKLTFYFFQLTGCLGIQFQLFFCKPRTNRSYFLERCSRLSFVSIQLHSMRKGIEYNSHMPSLED